MAHNRIFLSYKSADKGRVLRYRDALSAIGFDPWMDEDDLPVGNPLVRALQDGMASCCAAVFFVTPKYLDESYIRVEIDEALQQKTGRGAGFALITLLLPDDEGRTGAVPAPLATYTWGKPKDQFEGLRILLGALPAYMRKKHGDAPTNITNVVPPNATEVAVVDQNLGGPLGQTPQRYERFRGEIKALLARSHLQTLVLMMMCPKALAVVDANAARHLRKFSLPGLRQLRTDISDASRVQIVFHPAATLSMLAVDWELADRCFALVTPKFQITAQVDNRVSVLLNEREFDAASLTGMIRDAMEGAGESRASTLQEAPELLESLLVDASL